MSKDSCRRVEKLGRRYEAASDSSS